MCTGVQVTTEPGPLLPRLLAAKPPGSCQASLHTHRTLSTSRASWVAAGGLGEPASSWAQRVPLRAVLPVTLRHLKGGWGRRKQAPTRHPPLAEPQAGDPAMPSDHACRSGAAFQGQRGSTGGWRRPRSVRTGKQLLVLSNGGRLLLQNHRLSG